MPSIFHRHRASDVTPATFKSDDDPSSVRQKRLSVDNSAAQSRQPPSSPPSSGGKIKAFFGGGSGDRDSRRESLKKRLTSPSTFFKSQADLTDSSPSKPPVNGGESQQEGVMARYNDPLPRANGTNSGQFASPTLFPENFTLSTTQSPESPIQANGHGRRGSVTWQPSYPLVVPDDEYANVPPDGQAAPNGVFTPASPASVNENTRRRSAELFSPPPETLQSWQPLQPTAKPATPPPPPTSTALLTPPPSALAESKKSADQSNDALPKGRDRRPSLSLNLSDPVLKGFPLPSGPPVSADVVAQSAITPPTSVHSMVPLNDTPGAKISASMPSSPLAPSRPRPAPPMRKPTLIQSPPMPQPIKNLPTMQGWPGFQQVGGSNTPGWGSLAREGGPRTPGFGTASTPGGSRTPGLSGFPWATPLATPSGKGKEKSYMTEEEIRKARRSMPVMLREPSFKPKHDEEEGGDAGDDDDDDESDTELEGGDRSDDDSDGATETENKAGAGLAAKMLTRGLMGKSTPKGKGKGKASTQVSPMAKTAVEEEGDHAANPPSEQTALAERRQVNFPRLGQMPLNSPSVIVAKPKSVWSLNTPSQQKPQISWTQFGSPTPRETPAAEAVSQRIPSPISEASGPSTASLSRNQSYGSTAQGTPNSSGYFDSHPSSSQVSISQISTGTLSTPMGGEPVLPKGSGTNELVSSGLTNAVINAPVTLGAPEAAHDDAEGDDESDGSSDDGTNEGSMEINASSDGHGESSPEQTTSATVPQPPYGSAAKVKRPAIYTQVSRSMINLPTPQAATPGEAGEGSFANGVFSAKPGLSTIRSGEKVPTHIDLPPREPAASTAAPKGVLSPIAEWVKPPPTPAGGLNTANFWGKDKDKDKGDASKKPQPLKRRRSADDMMAPPPKYEPPFPGTYIPRPRDEEGKEKLPGYWCAVHIEGMLLRKMEFSSPGVQSRDRSWKKVYLILHGTSLRVYKFDPHRFPLKVESPIPTITEEDSEEFLHVHTAADRRASVSGPQPNLINSTRRGSVAESVSGRRASVSSVDATGRRGSLPDILNPSTRRGSVSTGNSPNPNESHVSTSSTGSPRASFSPSVGSSNSSNASLALSNNSDVKDPALFPARKETPGVRRPSVSSTGSGSTSHTTSIASHFQHNALLKHYTLQKAESGLAADYQKRKNVVRLRLCGEQFLVQTDSARDTVDWIEAFQAATNCALDLDERPMPKIITLPRRRRRRPGQAGANATNTANGTNNDNANNSGGASGTGTPTSAAAAGAGNGPPSSAVTEMERLLAEDQERPLG